MAKLSKSQQSNLDLLNQHGELIFRPVGKRGQVKCDVKGARMLSLSALEEKGLISYEEINGCHVFRSI